MAPGGRGGKETLLHKKLKMPRQSRKEGRGGNERKCHIHVAPYRVDRCVGGWVPIIACTSKTIVLCARVVFFDRFTQHLLPRAGQQPGPHAVRELLGQRGGDHAAHGLRAARTR